MSEREPASPTGNQDGDQSNGSNRKSATIYDIARVAGVSPSTVSRALNVPGRINEKTERRIREAAEALGYRTNPLARALHTGRTGTLGLIVSDITNPVFFDFVHGAERVTAGEGLTLVFADSQESADIEMETAERLTRSVDGFVLVASRLDDDTIRKLAEQKPLVVANRQVDGVTGVVPDVTTGIHAVFDHLASLGHRSIAYLAGPAASWMSALRWETMLDEALARDLSIVEIGPNTPTMTGGGECLKRVRASGATAVLAYNDLMAIGLLHACQAEGIDIPDDLTIVGFDDIFGSTFTAPPLTTVRSPLGSMGEQAIRQLIAAIEGQEVGAQPPLATELVVRGSSSAPRSPIR